MGSCCVKKQSNDKANVDQAQGHEIVSPPLIRPGKLKISNKIVLSGSNQIAPSLNIKNSRLVRLEEYKLGV